MSFNILDYIVVFDNIIPHELCDRILQEYANVPEWDETIVRGGLDKNIRNADTILISHDHVIAKNQGVRKQLDDDLFQCANLAIRQYNEKFKEAFIDQDSGYQLLRYISGQFYTQHTDSFKDAPRSVSCSFALNDDYEGGEFGFFSRYVTIKANKGAAIMFPSNFMYPHEILPVTKGTRYSIITWFI
jgi:predicted 2-oxoglutarate/Fe(II)-dependent dioxygenase YbiX